MSAFDRDVIVDFRLPRHPRQPRRARTTATTSAPHTETVGMEHEVSFASDRDGRATGRQIDLTEESR